jgi:hypothetical protein
MHLAVGSAKTVYRIDRLSQKSSSSFMSSCIQTIVQRFKRKFIKKAAKIVSSGCTNDLTNETIKFYDTVRFGLLNKLVLKKPNVLI